MSTTQFHLLSLPRLELVRQPSGAANACVLVTALTDSCVLAHRPCWQRWAGRVTMGNEWGGQEIEILFLSATLTLAFCDLHIPKWFSSTGMLSSECFDRILNHNHINTHCIRAHAGKEGNRIAHTSFRN